MEDNNKNQIKLEHIANVDHDVKPPKSPIQGLALARIVVAFWILGMCNNYIYVIMLSAAHDIITKVEAEEDKGNNVTTTTEAPDEYVEGRNCTSLTTGAILLADIIPTLVVKLICPFLPFYVHFRLLITIVTGILSLVLVATSESILMAIVGVCFASFNSGLGEITLLAYSTNFVLHAIAGWSSGTGGAGLVGSFAYATMTEGGLTPSMSLYISIAVPVLMAVAFWIILKHPEKERNFFSSGDSLNPSETRLTLSQDIIEELSEAEEVSSDSQCGLLVEPTLDLRYRIQRRNACMLRSQSLQKTLIEKICFIPVILPFMIPVGLVYYFEYLINSGLFDKIVFTNTSMTKASQFRWYNAMYQVGVFVSRSSVTWVHFKKVWIMSVLQAVNLVVFTLEAIYGFIPNVWFMFVLIFWEGLLGGAAYVNTFYNMSYMVKKEQRLFALSIASVADTFGIVSAGLSSFPLHDAICRLPFEPVFRWPK